MAAQLAYLPETPSQTAGPYVHIGLAPLVAGLGLGLPPIGAEIAPEGSVGERITIEGRILDGTGAPVRDAVIEIWQCDGAGRFAGAGGPFRGFGRVIPDLATGDFRFATVKPGPAGGQAPHLSLWLVARGINIGLHTRLYFPEDDHAHDPVLARIEQEARRRTLIAEAIAPGRYRFVIRLQGEDETVFLDI